MGVQATNPIQVAAVVSATRGAASDDKLPGSNGGLSPVISNPNDNIDPKEERAFVGHHNASAV